MNIRCQFITKNEQYEVPHTGVFFGVTAGAGGGSPFTEAEGGTVSVYCNYKVQCWYL